MTSGYVACREAIEKCRLKEPVVYEPFTACFDTGMLESVRDHFGYDLYREVMGDMDRENGGAV